MIFAVVPMKPLSLAKRRLSSILPERERQALVRAMLCDVLRALQGSSQVAQSFVLTADPALAALAADHDAGHIPEDAPIGLNSAVTTTAEHLETLGAGAMLILPGDVPLVSAAEIDELAVRSKQQGVGIVPAHDADGTNALLLAPPGALASSFGPGSFKRHLAAGRDAGFDPVTCVLEGLGRDIDTREDLEYLIHRTAGRAEYDCLRGAVTRDLVGTANALEQRYG